MPLGREGSAVEMGVLFGPRGVLDNAPGRRKLCDHNLSADCLDSEGVSFYSWTFPKRVYAATRAE